MKWLIDALFQKLGAQTKEERKTLILQFIKFGLVGVSNTLISWGVYYLFLWINEDLYLIGGIIGGVVSIANAFFWNDRFVFKSNANDLNSKLKRLGRTYVSYGGSGLFSIVLTLIEVEILGISKTLIPIINLCITVPLNYLVNKYWTFRPANKKQNSSVNAIEEDR